uniref:Uncharacterized protein n=1 Tax=Trypanosoma vivax (strain Y486) TaxID=1055687 RepID=G0UBU2_TRYVY|nr:hypothetical protein TVY486_1107740 [Trypanosoma vivax Y486]
MCGSELENSSELEPRQPGGIFSPFPFFTSPIVFTCVSVREIDQLMYFVVIVVVVCPACFPYLIPYFDLPLPVALTLLQPIDYLPINFFPLGIEHDLHNTNNNVNPRPEERVK